MYSCAVRTNFRDHLEVVHEGVIIRCPYEFSPKTFKFRANILGKSSTFLNLPVWANFYGLTDLSTYYQYYYL